jgi:hypothetical protein
MLLVMIELNPEDAPLDWMDTGHRKQNSQASKSKCKRLDSLEVDYRESISPDAHLPGSLVLRRMIMLIAIPSELAIIICGVVEATISSAIV